MCPRIRFPRVLAIVLLASANTALPQESEPLPPGLEGRLQALERQVADQARTIEHQDQKIQGYEGRVREPDPERVAAAVDSYLEAKKKKGELGTVTAGYDGKFFLESANKDFRFEIGGYGQVDARWFPSGYPANNTWLPREFRPHFWGRLWKYYEFRIQFEVNTTGNNIRDGWLNFHYIDEAQLKVGQFKEFFSRDDLRGFENSDFVDSSYIQRLISPSRQPGAAVHGKLFDGKIEYGAGFFNGDGAGAADSNDDKEFSSRINVSPFKGTDSDWLKGLEIAASYTVADDDKSIGGRTFTTSAGTTFLTFDRRLRQNSATQRFGADMGWLIGPASFQGEFARMTIDDARRSATVLEDFEVDSFYVQGTYLLTGEDKTWKQQKPATNFDPKEGGWGAWELAGRYQYMDFNANTLESRIGTGAENVWSLTGGVNWYLNPHVEIMLDYEYARYESAITPLGQTDSDEHVVSMRFEFLF